MRKGLVKNIVLFSVVLGLFLMGGCGGGGGNSSAGGSASDSGSGDITGTWAGTYTATSSGGTQNVTLTFTMVQSGSTISGTYTNSLGGSGTLSGSVSGSQVSFSWRQNGGCQSHGSGTGTVNGNTIASVSASGTDACIGSHTLTGTMTKQSGSANNTGTGASASAGAGTGIDAGATTTISGLMWQKQDDGVKRDWATAGTYCAGLNLGGYSDWRMPTISELKGIVDKSYRPAINPSFFTNTQSAHYWSSTASTDRTDAAMHVPFDDGGVDGYRYAGVKTNSEYVRCVRRGTGSSTGTGPGTVTTFRISDLAGNWSVNSDISFTVSASGNITNFKSKLSTSGSCFGGMSVDATYSDVSINTSDFSFSGTYSTSHSYLSTSSYISGKFTSASTAEGTWRVSTWNICRDTSNGTFRATKK